MVYGIGVNGNNNYWIPDTMFTGYNPVPSALWSFDLSAMSPQDSLGTLNDIQLFNNDVATNNLVNQVALLNTRWMPVLNNWMANMSALYQKAMMNISGNTNNNIDLSQLGPVDNANNGVNNPNNNSNTSFKDKIEESDVSAFIGRLGADPKWQAAFNEKITLEDGTETTILQRLVDLINDYMTNENPELSKEEFEQIQEIAGKYAKTGKINREDFLTLKRIVEAHKGTKETAPDDDEEEETTTTVTRPQQNVVERAQSANGYKKTAGEYFDAMDGAGTDKGKLASASKATTKYNVIETIQTFNEQNEMEGDGLTLAEKIFDDCDNWGTGNNHGWLTQNAWGDDDAKPFINRIKESLISRTNDFIAAGHCDEATKTALQNAVADMEKSFNNVKKGDLSKSDKESVSAAIDKLFNTLLKAEQSAYKKFDEDNNITDEHVI